MRSALTRLFSNVHNPNIWSQYTVPLSLARSVKIPGIYLKSAPYLIFFVYDIRQPVSCRYATYQHSNTNNPRYYYPTLVAAILKLILACSVAVFLPTQNFHCRSSRPPSCKVSHVESSSKTSLWDKSKFIHVHEHNCIAHKRSTFAEHDLWPRTKQLHEPRRVFTFAAALFMLTMKL